MNEIYPPKPPPMSECVAQALSDPERSLSEGGGEANPISHVVHDSVVLRIDTKISEEELLAAFKELGFGEVEILSIKPIPTD